MVDYNELRKKFPPKDPSKTKRAAAIKAIAREYERKRAELGLKSPPVMKKGIVFYAVVVIGLLMLGALVLSATGRGGRKWNSRADIQARKSVDALATALGRYRYHVGQYPTTEEGLAQLASTTVRRKGWNGPYIRKVVPDPWGSAYEYVCNGEAENPTLYSKGPDGLAGTSDDVLPPPELFDAPFRDTTWTQGWVPYTLRGYVVAPDEETKKRIEREVQEYLNPPTSVEGETALGDGWEPSEPPAGAPAGAEYVRRAFELPKSAEGSFVALRFEGVAPGFEAHVGGARREVRDCGLRSAEVDISGVAAFGATNSVVARSGSFRSAKLVVEDAEDRMVFGSLAFSFPEVSEELAKVHVEYETPLGKVENDVEIKGPILWTPERPFMYRYKICGKDYAYAIRKLSFDGGFRLNGSVRAFHAVEWSPRFGLGGDLPGPVAASRWLRAFKSAGANAVRIPASELDRASIELCDRMGMVVCDGSSVVDAVSASGRGESAALDWCALPNDEFYRLRADWYASEPTVRVFPHWNRDAREGDKVSVGCYSSGDESELFVNGESCGKRRKGVDGAFSWEVPYETGEVKVIAYREGHVIGEDVCKTAYKAAAVRVEPEVESLADGDCAFVRVWLEDEYGTALPTAADKVSFALEGPGEIVAAGNGAGEESASKGAAASCALASGRAMAVVLRHAGSGRPLRLVASVGGLRPGSAMIPRRAGADDGDGK